MSRGENHTWISNRLARKCIRRKPPESERLLAVLDEAVAALRGADITFLLMGGLATSVLGRGRGVTDIDLFVRDRDVGATLAALEMSGFETMVVSPNWLAKGFKDGVLVDVISRSTHDITLTDEILERAIEVDVHGRRLPCVSPEDLIVMKAVATTEDTARYWYDALSLLGRPGPRLGLPGSPREAARCQAADRVPLLRRIHGPPGARRDRRGTVGRRPSGREPNR